MMAGSSDSKPKQHPLLKYKQWSATLLEDPSESVIEQVNTMVIAKTFNKTTGPKPFTIVAGNQPVIVEWRQEWFDHNVINSWFHRNVRPIWSKYSLRSVGKSAPPDEGVTRVRTGHPPLATESAEDDDVGEDVGSALFCDEDDNAAKGNEDDEPLVPPAAEAAVRTGAKTTSKAVAASGGSKVSKRKGRESPVKGKVAPSAKGKGVSSHAGGKAAEQAVKHKRGSTAEEAVAGQSARGRGPSARGGNAGHNEQPAPSRKRKADNVSVREPEKKMVSKPARAPAPGTPRVPGTPNAAPGTPRVPGTPRAVPGTPHAVPGTPHALPGTPRVPGTPGATSVPGTPHAPGPAPTSPFHAFVSGLPMSPGKVPMSPMFVAADSAVPLTPLPPANLPGSMQRVRLPLLAAKVCRQKTHQAGHVEISFRKQFEVCEDIEGILVSRSRYGSYRLLPAHRRSDAAEVVVKIYEGTPPQLPDQILQEVVSSVRYIQGCVTDTFSSTVNHNE